MLLLIAIGFCGGHPEKTKRGASLRSLFFACGESLVVVKVLWAFGTRLNTRSGGIFRLEVLQNDPRVARRGLLKTPHG